MKIWIDALTPKQLLMSEMIVKKLGKRHNVLCTSREYGEVSPLAKIRSFAPIFVGKHGGATKENKLKAGIDRMGKLAQKIQKFSPDITVSFCSPDAARVSFGLGIKHVSFCDTPHANAQCRLVLPFVQKLLVPYVIPKKDLVKFGIDEKKILHYKAVDAYITIQRKADETLKLPFKNNGRKNILIRLEEEEASYTTKSVKIIPIIKKIASDYKDENIVILGRYTNQIKNIQKQVSNKVKVVRMSFDGKHLLDHTDVFIGSGGTMSAESALMGIPTISYHAVPNAIEDFLVKKRLIKVETMPNKISMYVGKAFKSNGNENKKNAAKVRHQMENPIDVLIKVIGV